MQYAVGFIIALFISLTGVGAGTITVPLLVLFLGVPAPLAVGIGLMFSAAIKAVLLPVQMVRRQVKWRTLGYMLLGGTPGVLIGSLGLKHLVTAGSITLVNGLLGVVLVGTASWQIFYSLRGYSFRGAPRLAPNVDRSSLLPWLMLPVGAEVGFSSAGAGALGSAALLGLTPLSPTEVVGTDIAFGFLMSLIGSGAHWAARGADPQLLLHLVAGGLLGALTGTLMSTSIPRRPLRFALWVWLLVLGGQFLVKSYRAPQAPKVATDTARAVSPRCCTGN